MPTIPRIRSMVNVLTSFFIRKNVNDSTTGNLGIKTAASATAALQVNAVTTNDTAAQVLIGAGTAANRALVLQGAPSQTSRVLDVQDSNGISFWRISQTYNALFGRPVQYDSVNVASSATVTATSSAVQVFTGAAGQTITLNFGSGNTSMIIVNNTANTVAITPSSGTINGAATINLAANAGVTVVSNGTNYWTV